ncbi:sulfotransferase family protein [Cognatishimia sp.]|uniref:sulfotransferase family protein n=1 Tax=Cognatishimia sp. TaxID=2211648 RepID=UPI0035119473
MTVEHRNFIYLEDFGFIFAYVPKVACTNWKSLMRFMVGKQDWLDNRLAHDKKNGGLRYLNPCLDEDLDVLNDVDLQRFAMVRDPFGRLLSAYLNKVERNLPITKERANEDHFKMIVWEIEEFRKATLDLKEFPEISFEVFLLWLKDSGSWFTNDEHWASQTKLLRQPGLQFDFIGRFERIQEDAAFMLSEMGCEMPFPNQSDVNFAPTNASEKLDVYLSERAKGLIGDLYRDDFINFDYSL